MNPDSNVIACPFGIPIESGSGDRPTDSAADAVSNSVVSRMRGMRWAFPLDWLRSRGFRRFFAICVWFILWAIGVALSAGTLI
jgi:hypothetical protein